MVVSEKSDYGSFADPLLYSSQRRSAGINGAIVNNIDNNLVNNNNNYNSNHHQLQNNNFTPNNNTSNPSVTGDQNINIDKDEDEDDNRTSSRNRSNSSPVQFTRKIHNQAHLQQQIKQPLDLIIPPNQDNLNINKDQLDREGDLNPNRSLTVVVCHGTSDEQSQSPSSIRVGANKRRSISVSSNQKDISLYRPVDLGLALDIGLGLRKPASVSGGGEEGSNRSKESLTNNKKELQQDQGQSPAILETNYSSVQSSPMSTNSGELLYQRTPLLNGGWHDDNQEEDSSSSQEIKRNGSAIRIDIPACEIEQGTNVPQSTKRFPKERRKTFIAFVFLVLNFILATLALALTHERVPKRPPLPDIILDNITAKDWALDVSEILIVISTIATGLALLTHKYRWIVFRRVFIILGVLYAMRSLTMYVTVLPVASTTYYCSPKVNATSFTIIIKRVLQLTSGFGLSINGQHTFCGDYIYSGHTLILVMCFLLIQEYTPKKFLIAHWISWLTSLTGIVMVVIARGHYTIDVVIAYYVTTRVFWIYHTMANNFSLKNNPSSNYFTKCWWYTLFAWFERNVNGPLPRQYNFPIKWSKLRGKKSHRHQRRSI